MLSTLLRAHLALLAVNLIYGANYLIAKGLMPHLIGPSGFIVLRVVGATLLFWLLRALTKHQPVAWKDFPRLILCAVFGVAINQLFFFNGLNLTSPINSAIIMTSNPILVLVIASLLIGEKITWLRVAGIAAGATGAVALILSGAEGSLLAGNPTGDLMILINAFSYAIYLVIVKPLMQNYSPLTVISWVFLIGMFLVLPVGIGQVGEIEWTTFQSSDWFALSFVIIGTTFLAYLLNIFAIKTLSPGTVSSYIYLQPITASIFSVLFVWIGWTNTDYTTGITPLKIISTLLIFIGVYLVSKPGIDRVRAKTHR
jgi:drug/metabolite transporter (DMT)-like permease